MDTDRSFPFTVTVDGGSASAIVTVLNVDEAPTITVGPTIHSVSLKAPDASSVRIETV